TQNVVDAAALAGAHALAADADPYTRAQAYISRNYLTHTFASNNEVIQLGEWDRTTRTFNPAGANINAVRVAVARKNAPLYFAPILGVNTFDVPREAIALAVPPAACRLWGINGVTIHGGSNTNSYDSTVAEYDPVTPGSDGDVCSCQDVRFAGTPTIIDGDVLYGNGYSFTTTGDAHATGDANELGSCIDTPLDFGDVATLNDNDTIGLSDGGEDPIVETADGLLFQLNSGDHITLNPGTYYFDEFKLNGNASLTVTGPTTFYISGQMTVNGGGIANETGDPWNLTIISSGDVAWSGSMDLYGSLYAPTSQVNISGGADVYGTAVAGILEIGGGSNFHVDESMPLYGTQAVPPTLVK
ncbi:MAG: TadG family pilus assembly protein, partial [Phycisphaerae bacterium]